MNDLIVNKKIFGNDAAEDELPEKLAEYYVNLADFEDFDDSDDKFLIVRGRKGTGKSTILSYFSYKLENKNNFVIKTNGSKLSQYFNNNNISPNEYINEWQKTICSYISLEIGRNIKFANNDDSISIVEYSEVEGFKGRNLIGSLLHRFKIKLGNFEIKEKSKSVSQELIKRYMQSDEIEDDIWIFIDDIDQTFINTEEHKLLLSSFFVACRYLVNDIPNLKIRTSIRSDVWWAISNNETLDKTNQYIRDIIWSTNGTKQILTKRIFYYLNQYDKSIKLNKAYQCLFVNYFNWRKKRIFSGQILHMYSLGRPRWVLQLCKLCISQAIKIQRKNQLTTDKINLDLIKLAMPEYSKIKLNDLITEYSSECSKLKEIIFSFYGGGARVTTNYLLIKLGQINKELNPTIDNNTQPSVLQLAHFLFRINFISAFTPDNNGDESYYHYEDKPHLLTMKLNKDDNMNWVIHPTFHVSLNLVDGFKKNSKKQKKEDLEELPFEHIK